MIHQQSTLQHMEKTSATGILSTFLVSCSIYLVACCPNGNCPIYPDPYSVDEGRQKENIYYVPAAANMPLLTTKHDFYGTLMRSSGEQYLAFETEAAFMIGKHAGVAASFAQGKNGGGGPDGDVMKYHRYELGAGYVNRFNKGWHFETYGGLGNEDINNKHHTGTSHIGLPYFFVQPTIAVSNRNQSVQFGISSRFVGAKFNAGDTLFNTDREQFSAAQFASLYSQPFHFMWEPAFVFRFGWQNFLFNTGFTYSADLTNPGLNRAKTNFTMGVTIRIRNTEQQ
jgi:hypothetical protein